MTINKLVDGGYLSWCFGASPWGLQSWSNGSWQKFRRSDGVLILMDSSESLRRGYYPDYKAHRAEKYAEDDERALAKERVTTLRNDIILEDPRLWAISIAGLEADDLIACILYLRVTNLEIPVIGIDKDLYQLPPRLAKFQDHQGKPSTLNRYVSKLPAAIQGLVKHHHLVPLILSLYGDKSDNIKKIVNNVREIVPVLKHKTPYQRAHQLYGDRFIHNLWLTVLPYPGIVFPIPDPQDLPRILDDQTDGWVVGHNVPGRFSINSEVANIINDSILMRNK